MKERAVGEERPSPARRSRRKRPSDPPTWRTNIAGSELGARAKNCRERGNLIERGLGYAPAAALPGARSGRLGVSLIWPGETRAKPI